MPVAFDTETFLIRPAQLAPRLVCLTSCIPCTGSRLWHVKHEGTIWGDGRYDPDGSLARDHFEWILQQDPIYGANVAFDMCVCAAEWSDLFAQIFKAYDEGRVIDIQLSQRLIDNANGKMTIIEKVQGYSLASLVKRHLKKDRSAEKTAPDAWRLRYNELYDVPLQQWPKAAVQYALDDAQDTFDVGTAQLLKYQQYLGDSPAQARAAFALQLMMCWGVRTDPERIEKLREASIGMYEKLTAELVREGLVRGDDAPPKQRGTRNVRAAQKRMLEVRRREGLPLVLTKAGYKSFKESAGEKTGAEPEHIFTEEELVKYIAVDEDACKESGDELLVNYSLRTQLHNILHTHIPDMLKGVDLPIQPHYKTMVESGRTSCSKTKDKDKKKKSPTNGFQFQNPKRSLAYFPDGVGIRECFIAREGTLFADPDFTGLELCTGAQACMDTVGYSRLAEALNAGRDPHLQFGAELMGITYEEALARKHEKEVKQHRGYAKCANFGFPGGLGVNGLRGFARGYGIKLSVEEAKNLRDGWFAAWPEWVDYFKYVRTHIDRVSGVGRIKQLRVNRVRGGVTYTSACNCLDDKTEALTQRGWVNGFYDLLPGDKLLTKNAATGELEWQHVFRIQRYPNYLGPIVEFKTKNFNSVTTPEHRWLVNDRKGNSICKTSKEIGSNGDFRIHRSGRYVAPKVSPYIDDFVELVGWVLTDGRIDKKQNRVSVYQSERGHPKLVRRLDKLFSRLGLELSRRTDERGGVVWTLGSRCVLVPLLLKMFPERVLTVEFLLQLTKKQLELLWTVMMLADGNNAGTPYLPNSKKEHIQVLNARSEQVAGAFQMLCTLVGFASFSKYRDMSKYKVKKYDSMPNIPKPKGVWLVKVLKRETVQIVNLKRTYGKSKTLTKQRVERVGKAKMWCPVVPNTYFVARRFGSVFITGNTLFQGLGADGAKHALYEVSKRCYVRELGSVLYGARPVGFIHDEILAEVFQEKAHEQATEMAKVMEDACNVFLPDVPVRCEPTLAKRWSKDIEAVYDRDGRLQPWDLAKEGRWEVFYGDGERVVWK